MTTQMTPEAGLSQVEKPGLLKRPLWILSGQVGVIVAVFIGFGARAGAKPKLTALLLLVCLLGLIGFGPLRRVNRIVISAPVVAITAWWMASYLWTFNTFGWWTDTQLVMPFVVACVVLVGLLPKEALRAALLAGCYLAIAYTVLEIAIHPGRATANPDGVPGWRGGFIHKNSMGPFMVFAVLVMASFDRPSMRRTLAILTASGLVVASQSTTALGAGLVTLLVYTFLRRLAASTRPARASLVVGALGVVILLSALSSSIFSTILGLSGKDATLTGRTDIWDGVWQAVEQRPWQGYGAGGVWGNPSVDPARSIMRSLGFTVFHSHNGFLEIMLLLGFVGLGLYVWLMGSTIRLGLANLREDTPVAVFGICYVVLVVVASLSEVVVFGIWLGVLCAIHCLMLRMDSHRRLALARTGVRAQDL